MVCSILIPGVGGGDGGIRNSWSVAKAWNRWYTCSGYTDNVGAASFRPHDK